MGRAMKIFRGAGYALMAVAYIAQHGKGKPVKAQTISETYGLSHVYLMKIMVQLAKVYILGGKRGPGGGFVLGSRGDEVTMLDVIEAIDGSMEKVTDLTEMTGNAPFAVKMEQVCNDAAEKARDRFQKAKLSKMIG
jgi:Rrf2 family protein